MITGAYDVFGVVNANTEYIYYMYLSFDDAKSLKPLYRGLRKTIPLTSLRSSYLFLPSPKEQDKIVSFIKKKSTQIDLSISETEKEIENLNELKQTEIAHLVTHGLNPNVPMKDSGIPWIGQIPEHWDVKRLAMVAFEHKMSNKDIHHQNLLSLSYGNVIRKDINKTEGLLPSSFDGYQIVEKGNIILRLTDLQNDHKSLRVGMVEEKGIITSAYLCLGVRDNINPLYLYYLLHSYDILKVFYSMGSGLRQSLNYEQMKKMGIVVPPANEQSFIIVAIKAITSKIDRMVNGLNNQITYLKELKQRIISDAVTGKIDVREGSIS
jgi:type I restriction enzyme S subunit